MKLGRIKLIFATACFCFLAYQPCAAQYPSQEEHDWVERHFFTVLEELMPIEGRLGFSLGYRSYRDLHRGELEYSFLFNHLPLEKIEVVVRMPDSVSLYDQIMTLHRRNPQASIEDIKPQLSIREQRFSEESCPAVRRQYDEFYRLSLLMLTAADRAERARGEITIILHPRVHTFKAHISDGSIELSLAGSEHPFVRWAERTQRAFTECAAKQNRK